MIRRYTPADYSIIWSWCTKIGISTLNRYSLPATTYIFEYEHKPVLSLSLITTNAKDMAYLEYFIADPDFQSDKRQQMSKDLISYVEDIAKSMGYNKIRCLASNDSLRDYYSSYGYKPNLEGLTLLVKET